MAIRRRIKDGYITIHRGIFAEFPPKKRQELSRLGYVNGGNHDRIFEALYNRRKGENSDLFAVYVDDENGKAIGWVNWRKNSKKNLSSVTHPYPIEEDCIRYFYVQRNHRRRGIGTVLMNEVYRYVPKSEVWDYPEVYLYEENAKEFFNEMYDGNVK